MILNWYYYIFVTGLLHWTHGKEHTPILPELVNSIVENELAAKMPHEADLGSQKHHKRSRLTGSHMKAATDAINKLVDESIVNRVEEAEKEVSQMLLKNIEHHIQDAGKIFKGGDDKPLSAAFDRNVCRDKLDGCAALSQAGVCKTSRDAMRENCRQTCNYCHVMLDHTMQAKLAKELESHSDGGDKVLTIKFRHKGKKHKKHRLGTEEVGLMGSDQKLHEPELEKVTTGDSRESDDEQAKELERIKGEANKLLAAQRKIKQEKLAEKERHEAERLLETEKKIKEEEQKEFHKHPRHKKKKKAVVHKPVSKGAKCHPICALQCIPICSLDCCTANPEETKSATAASLPDSFCHPLCRQICLPSCGDGCCTEGSEPSAEAPSPPAPAPPAPPSPPKKPPAPPPPAPPPVNLEHHKGLCPPSCPIECAPYCLDSCCASRATTELAPPAHPAPPSKESASQCPNQCSQTCAPDCTPGCCSLYPKMMNSIKGMLGGAANLPMPGSKMQTPFLALMTGPMEENGSCNPSCPAHMPSCCRSSKVKPPAPPIMKTPVSARLQPGSEACASEGLGATEECSEKQFHDQYYDQSNDPPGTVVIPLPSSQYTAKPGEPPAPIPDMSIPLSALTGKAAAAAHAASGGRCPASCPQGCAPECRDDCCTSEVPKSSPASPPPPPSPPASPAGPIPGIAGVVEVNPTLVNVPAPDPSNPGVIELKPSEVMVPMDTCPAKCSPNCLPNCDYDCCKPYLDPNIVAEMANELNYMHPNPTR